MLGAPTSRVICFRGTQWHFRTADRRRAGECLSSVWSSKYTTKTLKEMRAVVLYRVVNKDGTLKPERTMRYHHETEYACEQICPYGVCSHAACMFRSYD